MCNNNDIIIRGIKVLNNYNSKIEYAQGKLNFLITRLKQVWIVMLICTVLATIAGGIIARTIYRPEYTVTQAFTIELKNNPTAHYGTVSDNQLSKTIPNALSSQTFIDHMEPYIKAENVSGMFKVTSLSSTNIFYLTVIGRTNDDCLKIIELLEQHYPDMMDMIVGESRMVLLGEASTSNLPSNSPHYLKGAICGGASMIALILIALIVQSIVTNTIMDSNSAQNAIGAKCLATIDEIKIKRRSADKHRGNKMPLITSESAPLELKQSISTAVSKILAHYSTEKNKVIMTTSTISGEGKSSVSANIACELAELGHRTLIIDCDLRSPSLFTLLGYEEHSNELSKAIKHGIENASITQTSIENLYLLCNGEPIEKAPEIANGGELKKLVEELRQKFDYIILDTPPIGFLGDGISIAECADGFVYIISYNYVSSGYVLRSLSSMNESSAEMLGFIINHKS